MTHQNLKKYKIIIYKIKIKKKKCKIDEIINIKIDIMIKIEKLKKGNIETFKK